MVKFFYFWVISFFIFLGNAYGHGTGQSLEKSIDNYLIDIDYDNQEIRAGETIRFNFNIWNNKERTEAPEFTDVWARIAPQNSPGIVYAGDMHKPSFGSSGFTYIFANSGLYELTVRFQNKDKTLTEDIVFPLTVLKNESTSMSSNKWLNSTSAGIAGIFLGLTLSFFLKGKRV